MATAASRVTNPLLLLLIAAVVANVVVARRGDAPWARGLKSYFLIGLLIIAFRVVFRMLFDAQYGSHILFRLPEIPTPNVTNGIELGGPVSAEGLLSALYEGMRLSALLLCIGAANVLANPKRLLKAVPSALHEAGVAVTVALTVAPQLIESGQRVRRARRLRGESPRRFALVRSVLLPVLMDALDRSLSLAAAMDGRGYGRAASNSGPKRATTATLILGGLGGICVGAYGLLDASTPRFLGLPMLLGGVALAWVGLLVGGRRIQRTRYRPDPWARPEWLVAATGVAVAAVVIANPSGVGASLFPLRWPSLPLVPTVGICIGLLPAWFAPPVVRPARARRPSEVAVAA